MPRKYMTVKEAAERLAVSVRTIHRMIHDGELPPAIRMGKRMFRFDVQEFDSWEQSVRQNQRVSTKVVPLHVGG